MNTPGVHAVTPNSVTAPGARGHRAGAEQRDRRQRRPAVRAQRRRDAAFRIGSTSLLDVNPLNALPALRQPLQVTVRADQAWRRATGRGVGVAVIDTGIAGDLRRLRTAASRA